MRFNSLALGGRVGVPEGLLTSGVGRRGKCDRLGAAVLADTARPVAANVVSGFSRTGVVSGFSQTKAAQAQTSIRLYVFDGGVLESDPTRYRLTKEDVGTTQLSVAAYLIVHPRGVLLWDTGAVPDESWKPTGSPVQQRLVLPDGQERASPSVAAQRAVGRERLFAARRTHLALSHYHWDHTANANVFARATWLVRQNERDAMFADKPLGTATPMTYSALKTSKTIIVTADEHDVFGDGASSSRARPDIRPVIRCSSSSWRRPAAWCCPATCITIRRSGP